MKRGATGLLYGLESGGIGFVQIDRYVMFLSILFGYHEPLICILEEERSARPGALRTPTLKCPQR